ncbi:MAG: YihY/virulence factor BrkB family protein [Desulfobacterales bacterium]|nr:YihY/virulence factor BrkB family protein [Desulfobacterales bacterium]
MAQQKNHTIPRADSMQPISPTDRLQHHGRKVLAWIWSDTPADNRLAEMFRNLLQVLLIFLRECQRDRIGLRSSALTFTVVLSLVPTLALGTAVLKGFGAGDQMRQAAYRFIDQLELSPSQAPAVTLEGETTASIPPVAGKGNATGTNLTTHLHRAVDRIFDYVDRTNFTTLGAFGIIGLLAAVISVLGSIEQAMNSIWQAESNRPFARRIMNYLALTILLPISINLALATATVLQSPAIMDKLRIFIPLTWFTAVLLKLLPLLAVMLTFAILYAFLPNTRVRLLPALAGGILGGISWVLIQALYVKLQIGVARYNAIYGSFATLPLLLLWIYIGWLVFLAGAEVAFAVQTRRSHRWKELPLTPADRLSLAFEIMGAALDNFRNRTITAREGLAGRLNRPVTDIGQVLNQLLANGLLRHVDGDLNGYLPAAPEEEIKPEEIVELILGPETGDRPLSPLAAAALQGAKTTVQGKKIISDFPRNAIK